MLASVIPSTVGVTVGNSERTVSTVTQDPVVLVKYSIIVIRPTVFKLEEEVWMLVYWMVVTLCLVVEVANRIYTTTDVCQCQGC